MRVKADYNALFLFAGLGGGALGFARAAAAHRGTVGRFRVCGAVDSDPKAAADFERLVGARCTVGNLSTMGPAELRAACDAPPDIIFTSPPCKSFSGCLPAATAETPRYRDMADLALRGLWLALEAWPAHPPKLILLENVPRIQSRGRVLLDQITAMLRAYGYACRETVHDCGELGGLAQRRRRFLLVARHMASVRNFWFEPPRRALRAIGEVIGALPIPLPGAGQGGPLHRLPSLSALNWVRLALVPPGGDWRNLPERVELGPASGAPRVTCDVRTGAYGVTGWDSPSTTVIGYGTHHNGPWQVADPRPATERRRGTYGVSGWGDAADTVIGHTSVRNASAAAADPRAGAVLRVVGSRIEGPAEALARLDLANPRPLADPPLILGADGTWHRPLTTLELAALQGLPVGSEAEGWLRLAGRSAEAWRERIGNAVPPPTAEAIAESALSTLLVAGQGEWALGATGIWVEEAQA